MQNEYQIGPQAQGVRKILARGLVALGLSFSFAIATAAGYPEKPIRMLVGFDAGGTTDLIARVAAQQLSIELGVPVIVENRPGAGGNVAAQAVAQAQADGYTLLVGAINQAISPSLYRHLAYDQLRDLKPVAMLAATPNVLVVSENSPYNSVSDLIAAAKADKTAISFGSAGAGTSNHLSGELFKVEAGVDMLHVPYKGISAAETGLMSGQVTAVFDSIVTAIPLMAGGRIKALAVTSGQRAGAAPSVPTIAESGVPGFDVTSWYAVFAPSTVPAVVVQRLNASLKKTMAMPAILERLHKLGADPLRYTPEEADKFVRAEVEKWRGVIEKAKIRID